MESEVRARALKAVEHEGGHLLACRAQSCRRPGQEVLQDDGGGMVAVWWMWGGSGGWGEGRDHVAERIRGFREDKGIPHHRTYRPE